MVDPSCADLATKAELQELRDQLNAVLGERENGGIETIFQAGATTAATASALTTTVYALTKTRAAEAIVDIGLDNPAYEPIWRDYAKGNAKWSRVKANGTRTPLPDLSKIGKVSGQAAGAGAAAAATTTASVATMGALIGLVNLAATLALNIATVKVFDKRIDAEAKGTQQSLDAMNASMLRLYQKNQGNISQVQQEISENRVITNQNRELINQNRLELQQVQISNGEINTKLIKARSDIENLKSANEDLAQKIIDFQADYEEVTQDLQSAVEETNAQLDLAIETIETQQQQIADTELEIEVINEKITNIELKIDEIDKEQDKLREDFELLEADLRDDLDLIDARSKLNEARIIILESRSSKPSSGGGFPSAAIEGIADVQNKTLELTNKLSGKNEPLPQITPNSILNDNSPFERFFDDLILDVENPEMQQQQLEELQENLKTDWTDILTVTLQALVIGTMSQIREQTTEEKQIANTQTGICQSLNNPTACQVPGVDNPKQGLKGMSDGLGNKLDALQTLLDLTILKYVKSTNETVLHAKHGLEEVQKFAEKAWQATHADKILNAVTTAIVIHNGIQLSQNLLVTLGETATVVLQAIGVKDSKNEDIDVNAWFQVQMRSWMESILGTENYAALTTRIAKYNRIYQAGANVLDASRELFDSARSTAELTAENTGKIGNALLESGVVSEDSYSKMVDKVYPHSKAMRRLERFRNGLEEVEDSVSTVGNIASEVVSTKDAFTELKEAKKEWKEANDALVTEKDTATNETKEESTVVDGIKNTDFDKKETEE